MIRSIGFCYSTFLRNGIDASSKNIKAVLWQLGKANSQKALYFYQLRTFTFLRRPMQLASLDQEQQFAKSLPLKWPEFVKEILPTLDAEKHKGQCGRIAVVGGSFEYTGAPYFSAMSSLRAGVDMAHIFCEDSAAAPIKTYSPELIVHPILTASCKMDKTVEETSKYLARQVAEWLTSLHCVVVGPGLGRNPLILETVAYVIEEVTKRHIPLVIDADGLYLLSVKPELLKNATSPVILTPNHVEFNRLTRAFEIDDTSDTEKLLKTLAKSVCPGAIIVQKGSNDLIAAAFCDVVVHCVEQGSLRRCGGQGDILSGLMGAFSAWMQMNRKLTTPNEWFIPVYSACAMTRRCSLQAFRKKQRSMLTTDIIEEIWKEFNTLFPLR
ncbi:carbohydrate kinase family isoform 2 [Galdieria sulphuraria]|uniref:ATP-dependent (S)-NAD(P)H-hydrate dehydratase n=1 Tax=Galdieria sulphuraria TaxID=130081 RepID=M2XSY5_GALSU|nr:carbohydrate kinase family isoform 2 [Galdieria sulphuraria]EME26773.1 carbohydrate kinase family isoform 2 [Galdieria sulphuraria]|eukprot:XP_005703293.1 carbohydrate kinase family isoform 2 [Galdieria sulphuraria]